MARRRTKTYFRRVLPDPVYNSELVSRFINSMMVDGKKFTAEAIFYRAMKMIKEKTGKEGIEIFNKAVDNIKPLVEVKSRRVGGANYQVPIEVYPKRKQSLAIRWIIAEARTRSEISMDKKLTAELIDASKSLGGAFKKKDEIRRMAEANRAFSHYAW